MNFTAADYFVYHTFTSVSVSHIFCFFLRNGISNCSASTGFTGDGGEASDAGADGPATSTGRSSGTWNGGKFYLLTNH